MFLAIVMKYIFVSKGLVSSFVFLLNQVYKVYYWKHILL